MVLVDSNFYFPSALLSRFTIAIYDKAEVEQKIAVNKYHTSISRKVARPPCDPVVLLQAVDPWEEHVRQKVGMRGRFGPFPQGLEV